MNIKVNTYTLELDENELTVLALALKEKLMSPVVTTYCARRNGVDTLKQDYFSELAMLNSIFSKMGKVCMMTEFWHMFESSMRVYGCPTKISIGSDFIKNNIIKEDYRG